MLDYHFKLCIQPEPNTVDELEEEILVHISNDMVSSLIFLNIICFINFFICLINNLQNHDINNLQQDSYCLATVNNYQWYRALIISINKSAIVNFFDIGLMTEVSLKQVIS